MCRKLKALAYSCALAIALTGSGQADAAGANKPAPITEIKQAKTVEAEAPQPAVFRMEKGKSTVYILGSIHKLPAKFVWSTPAIEQVMDSADVFMFEANVDFATTEFHYFLDKHGYLPRGKTLPEMLSPAAQKRYAAIIAGLQIDSSRLDYLRPGVAVLMLGEIVSEVRDALGPGVDAAVIRYAKDRGKEIGYLESLQSHFELITTLGGGDDVAVLEKGLANETKEVGQFQAGLSAWVKGDLPQLDLVDDAEPEQRVLLLDNRNRAWVPRIEAMLEVPKTYLVTVGAGHLAGPNNVIELLCARGWKVQRVQTGAAPPPRACQIQNAPLRRTAQLTGK